MNIKSFRDLRVWQLGVELSVAVYRLTETFPRDEIYGLTSQMRRAAASVPSNISEGHAREHTKEFLHYLSVAQGSLAELDTQLEIARRLGYCQDGDYTKLEAEIASLGRQLYALRDALKRRAVQASAGVLLIVTGIGLVFRTLWGG